MNAFAKKIISTLIILMTWVVINDQWLQDWEISSALHSAVNDEGQNFNHIILGDSHGERIWLDHSLNFSSGGAALIFQFVKLLKTASHLEGANHVWIGIGPHNFSDLPIDRIENNFENYLTGNRAELAMLFTGLPVDTFSLSFHFNRLLGECLPAQKIGYQTGRLQTKDNQFSPDATEMRLTKHRVLQPHWFREHPSTTGVLQRIATMTDKQVYLVGTPLHKSYFSRIHPSGWNAYKKFLNELAENTRIQYIAVEDARLPDSFFTDADHLNDHGMQWLTDTLTKVFEAQNDLANRLN